MGGFTTPEPNPWRNSRPGMWARAVRNACSEGVVSFNNGTLLRSIGVWMKWGCGWSSLRRSRKTELWPPGFSAQMPETTLPAVGRAALPPLL
jgi:hypothetical protein